MATLTVDIVTPERVAFSGPADEVVAPGVGGEFGVLPAHALFLALLTPGVVTVKGAGGPKRFVVGPGFAEAGPDRIVVLTDSCEVAGTVDKATAERDLAEAQAVLATAAAGSEERLVAEQRAALARARLEA
ncbi:MAG: ATP synthase F1 subunit epsilon [Alphaproteobacteria bacterium]|nr:ATP synthase F1 subunit epsilon [Alphaproteobacteria bacterium]